MEPRSSEDLANLRTLAHSGGRSGGGTTENSEAAPALPMTDRLSMSADFLRGLVAETSPGDSDILVLQDQVIADGREAAAVLCWTEGVGPQAFPCPACRRRWRLWSKPMTVGRPIRCQESISCSIPAPALCDSAV